MSMQRDLLKIRRQASNLAPSSPPSSRSSPQPINNSSWKGNRGRAVNEAVHVAVRVRPLFSSEEKQSVIVSMDPSAKKIIVRNRDNEQQVFPFEMPVWSCGGKALDGSLPVTQASLYKMVGQPLLNHAFEGFNSTLMVYGTTGSGKTYTMMGNIDADFVDEDDDVLNDSDEGIVPRLCREMFQKIKERSYELPEGGTLTWDVHASYVEVYCEKISDLLNHGAPVTIREVTHDGEAHFALGGARRVNVHNSGDILHLLKVGNRYRKTASTSMNERSSRSHAIFVVELTEMLVVEGPGGDCVGAPGKLLTIRLVDLAGSERVGEAGMSGQLFKEGVDINCSLFTLGLVIESLSDPSRRQMRPPYRDSTLTKILKDAFGGNSKTTMICTIAPTEAQRSHTIQTLQYGLKARRIVNKPCLKESPSTKELRKVSEEMLSRHRSSRERRPRSSESDLPCDMVGRFESRRRQGKGCTNRREYSSDGKETTLDECSYASDEQLGKYKKRMEELEEEVERAKARYREQKRYLEGVRKEAAEEAEARCKDLEAQFNEVEYHLRRKGQEAQKKHREAETRLKELENSSEKRIASLLRTQEELKRKLHGEESASSRRERELVECQKRAAEELLQLREQMAQQEKEWVQRHKDLENGICTREGELRDMLRTTVEKMHAAEETAARREGELHRKWLDAQQRTRELHDKLAEVEADRMLQVSKDRQEYQKREIELTGKLEAATMSQKKLEHEALLLRKELDEHKRDQKNLPETNGGRLDVDPHLEMIREDLKKREERVRQREEEALLLLDEAMKKQDELNRLHIEKMTKTDTMEKEVSSALCEREIRLQRREEEVNQMRRELEMRSSELNMEARCREVELQVKEYGAKEISSREHRTAQLIQEELERTLERAQSDMKRREEKFIRLEEDMRECRRRMESLISEREQSSQQRPVPPVVPGHRLMMIQHEQLPQWQNCGVEASASGEGSSAVMRVGNCAFCNCQRPSHMQPVTSLGELSSVKNELVETAPAVSYSLTSPIGQLNNLRLFDMLFSMETRCRCLIEDSCNYEYKLLVKLETATPLSSVCGSFSTGGVGGLNAETVGKPPYFPSRERLCDESSHKVSACAVPPCSVPPNPVATSVEVEWLVKNLHEGQERLAQRTAQFDQTVQQREAVLRRKEDEVDDHLLKLEAINREKVAVHRLKEECAAALARLHDARHAFASHVDCVQQAFLHRTAEQERGFILLEESGERDKLIRLFQLQCHEMTTENETKASKASCEEILHQKEEMLRLEEANLKSRVNQLKQQEAEWRKRRAAEDENIRAYLLELQNEDMLYTQAMKDSQLEVDKAKQYCQTVQLREAEMQRLAHRLRDEAEQRERDLHEREKMLLQKHADAERALEERVAELERQRRDLSFSTELRERFIISQEAELKERLTRVRKLESNTLSPDVVQPSPPQCQQPQPPPLPHPKQHYDKPRQQVHHQQSRGSHRYYYIDIKKLLDICGDRLRCGKGQHTSDEDASNELTDSLIGVIESLKQQLQVWMQKYHVLKSEEKLECERCRWQNNRDATVCRCCGNTQLV